MKTRRVIASWGLTNVASLNVYEFRYSIEDTMLVGINDQEPEEVVVEFNHYGRAYIVFGGEKYYLDECIRL